MAIGCSFRAPAFDQLVGQAQGNSPQCTTCHGCDPYLLSRSLAQLFQPKAGRAPPGEAHTTPEVLWIDQVGGF